MDPRTRRYITIAVLIGCMAVVVAAALVQR
jgi:hypothetical protein